MSPVKPRFFLPKKPRVDKEEVRLLEAFLSPATPLSRSLDVASMRWGSLGVGLCWFQLPEQMQKHSNHLPPASSQDPNLKLCLGPTL